MQKKLSDLLMICLIKVFNKKQGSLSWSAGDRRQRGGWSKEQPYEINGWHVCMPDLKRL